MQELDDFQDLDASEMQNLGFAECFDQLLAADELIFTIPASDEARFRKGLAVAKSRMAKKLAEDGLAGDTRILDFRALKPAPNTPEGFVDLQCSLKERSGVSVFSIRKPDPSL